MFIKNKVVTVANVFWKPEKLVANLKKHYFIALNPVLFDYYKKS